MGFFSNLFKAAEVIGKVASQIDNKSAKPNSATNPISTEPVDNNLNHIQVNGEENIPVGKKISNILAEKFSQYEVRTNVSPTTIGGTGKFMDYSFGIYLAGVPKLFIMIVGKTTCSHRLYRWSKEQALRNNVNFINFVEHYPNEISYIEDRLAKYL
ncbi:MAG: hypothetical protein MJ211_10445 [Bacteroidales bacterium]|nr:hypothetical protein [Bacteroidales bacterium]